MLPVVDGPDLDLHLFVRHFGDDEFVRLQALEMQEPAQVRSRVPGSSISISSLAREVAASEAALATVAEAALSLTALSCLSSSVEPA